MKKVSEWSNELKANMGRWNYKNHRDFIQQTLDQQKQELVEMVRGMKSDEPSDNGLIYPVGALHKSYNQALDDIINKLESK